MLVMATVLANVMVLACAMRNGRARQILVRVIALWNAPLRILNWSVLAMASVCAVFARAMLDMVCWMTALAWKDVKMIAVAKVLATAMERVRVSRVTRAKRVPLSTLAILMTVPTAPSTMTALGVSKQLSAKTFICHPNSPNVISSPSNVLVI